MDFGVVCLWAVETGWRDAETRPDFLFDAVSDLGVEMTAM